MVREILMVVCTDTVGEQEQITESMLAFLGGYTLQSVTFSTTVNHDMEVHG